MANLVTCDRCGRFFELSDFGFIHLCPPCFQQDMQDFEKIRRYLYEHPGAKIFEVSTVLDIPVSQIKRYLREGRLEILEKNNCFLKCERCGKPICSGTHCDDCSKYADRGVKAVYTANYLRKGRHKLNYSLSGKSR